jgi:predicted Zn-dependent protease
MGMPVSPVSDGEGWEGPCPGEQDAGQATARRIDREWPLRGSGDPVTEYLRDLGIRLARQSARAAGVEWHFAVVRNRSPNAFSVGGGHVYVTDGAVSFAENESELAGILAHEIGHQLAGHFCGHGPVNDGFDDWFGEAKSSEAPAQVGIGSLMQVIDPAKERQADAIALKLMEAGGFDPKALLSLARRLPAANAIGHRANQSQQAFLEGLLTGILSRKRPDSEAFSKIKRIVRNE